MEQPKYNFPKYSNLSKFDRVLIESGYRKYGNDGVDLVKHYWVNHIDNEHTQFVQYLYQKSIFLRQSQFIVSPGAIKADGTPTTKIEADQ